MNRNKISSAIGRPSFKTQGNVFSPSSVVKETRCAFLQVYREPGSPKIFSEAPTKGHRKLYFRVLVRDRLGKAGLRLEPGPLRSQGYGFRDPALPPELWFSSKGNSI